MPSKRKKNKRRMRRVQAQRRALEEQHAANPPVKASRGIAVSAPPPGATKKAAPAPEKISQAILAAVPIVGTPKAEPKAEPVVEPIPGEVQVPECEAVVLEQIPAEAEIDVPAPVAEEAPVVETPSVVEPPTAEAAIVQEPEPKISETEPAAEATPPSEAAAVAPSETEIQKADSAIVKTETQQTGDVSEAEVLAEKDTVAEVEAEAEAEVEAEVAVTGDIAAPKPVTEASEITVAEALSRDHVSAAADRGLTETAVVVEVITGTPAAGDGAAATAAGEGGEELSAGEKAADVPAESPPDQLAPVRSVETPAVPDTNPEAPEQQAEARESTAATPLDAAPLDAAPLDATPLDAALLEAVPLEAVPLEAVPLDATPLDEFVVTESVSAVEGATESAAAQQEILPTSDITSTQTDSVDVAASEADPSAAPAKETDAAQPTCLDRLSEESKSETCDMQCQMQMSVESVQLSSAEMPLETALNAHIVPEVSIEG